MGHSPDQDSGQRDRFIEAARELGCGEDMDAFKAKLRAIARQRPKPPPDSGAKPETTKKPGQ